VVAHASVYTTTLFNPALPPRGRSPMPLIAPVRLPPAVLLQSAAPAAAAAAAIKGAVAGSNDGAPSSPLIQTGQPIPQGQRVAPDAYGTASELAIAPYATSRASADKLGATPTLSQQVAVTSYPWRAAGKLYFKIAGVDYVCSGSLIKPGLLVTAAHCVFEFGQGAAGWHTDFVFAPAQYLSGKPPPYATWTALTERVPSTYMDGTDTCVTAGVVCNNDIAIITLAANKAGKLPGAVVGWFGYGWGGYSSVISFGGAQLSLITQLGYPVAFDSGLMMERNDGIGALWTSGALKNTVLGGALTGGSSGGPWLVNFGAVPSVDTTQASLGTSKLADVVVGVTSWGYTTLGANTQGASFFGVTKEFPQTSNPDLLSVDRGAGNIGYLVMTACNANPDHC
jgi:V8-like Glu-specific endopeptidase